MGIVAVKESGSAAWSTPVLPVNALEPGWRASAIWIKPAGGEGVDCLPCHKLPGSGNPDRGLPRSSDIPRGKRVKGEVGNTWTVYLNQRIVRVHTQ